jgi:metallo-beta-lactamase family protein
MTTLTFEGAAGHVTGARFLLSDDRAGKILVDCGMRQDSAAEEVNRAPFGFDPTMLSAVVITHAHLDHVGLLPRLVREGYRRAVYMTEATKALANLMLEDARNISSLHAAEQGLPVLFEKEDVEQALSLVRPLEYGQEQKLEGGVTLALRNAGHILGSAMALLSRDEHSILFTGDLGQSPSALVADNDPVGDANYLVMESVYGDRTHGSLEARRAQLEEAIRTVAESRGVLLVPAFSLERSQIILRDIDALMREGKAPAMPVFLDSPLAIGVTEVYEKYPKFLNETARAQIEKEHIFEFAQLTKTFSPEESRAIDEAPSPKIIIAGAGMSHGGRIRRHEKKYLPEKNTVLLLVGYQVPGSLGRRLQDGETKVRIDNQELRVRADIRAVQGYSAHKDSDQLVDFVGTATEKLAQVFVTMGEPKASAFLAQRLRDTYGINVAVPEPGQKVPLDL